MTTCPAYVPNRVGYRLCGKPVANGEHCREHVEARAKLKYGAVTQLTRAEAPENTLPGCKPESPSTHLGRLVDIADGNGGHRLCDKPVGRDGVFCREHA